MAPFQWVLWQTSGRTFDGQAVRTLKPGRRLLLSLNSSPHFALKASRPKQVVNMSLPCLDSSELAEVRQPRNRGFAVTVEPSCGPGRETTNHARCRDLVVMSRTIGVDLRSFVRCNGLQFIGRWYFSNDDRCSRRAVR